MTTTPRTRRAAAGLLVVGLLLGAVGCSSDGDDADASTTTVISDDTVAGGDIGGTESTDCAADQTAGAANLSGSAAVLFAADDSSGVTEADITDATTLFVSADGTSMTPSTLTVSVGQVFGVEIAEGGATDGIVIGCAGGQTAPVGVPVGFVIHAAGTYPVSLDVAGTSLGQVVAR